MGRFVVITRPSGSGKTTVLKELLRLVPNSGRIVTTTTRGPREGEVDGVDYHFISRERFAALVERGEFLEHVEIYGHRYGSTIKALNEALAKHEIVFAVLDPRGALALKKRFKGFTFLFLVPGSIDELERRLTERGMDMSEAERKVRLDDAIAELALAKGFNSIVDNREGEFRETLQTIAELLGAKITPAL